MKRSGEAAPSVTGCSRWLLAACVLLLGLNADDADAFCPNNGHKCGFGGVGTTHKDMTEDTIEKLDEEYFGTDRLTKSMKNAIEEVWKANAEVDHNQVDGFWHFDGESFVTGKRRVSGLMAGVIRSLQAEDAAGARQQLGQALHTIQDFYSHTNFIESGNRGAYRAIWSGDVPFGVLAAPQDVTCEPCELVHDPISGTDSLDCSTNIVTSKLTSGYYGGENEVAPHNQKCRHGGLFDNGPGPDGGINKDVIFATFAPHNHLHFPAAGSARQATEQFIRDIRSQITDRQLKLLLGVGPTLAFSIDTTGSMGSVISQVRSQVTQIVNSRIDTPQEPLRYVLSPFNDPGIGPLTITDDPDTFKRAINALSAGGGGDCPELAMQGQLAALYGADKGVDLFTFTDADAKDAARAGAVSSLAAAKEAKIYPILNSACRYGTSSASNEPLALSSHAGVSPSAWGPLVDPAYRRIANDSGGQLFLLATSEIGRVTQLVDVAARANAVDLLSIADRLDGSRRDIALAIDPTLERVTFSLSGFSGLSVQRPDGSPVAVGDPGVSEIALSTGRILQIQAPTPGSWQVSVQGNGAYSLSVLGDSVVALDRFDFVEEAGRPGHQGYFDLEGFPVVGQQTVVTAELSGDVANATFELRDKAGATLQELDMQRESEGDPDEFFGELTLPGSPFLVYASGTLGSGESFQRVLPTQIQPQTVRVFAPEAELLVPGQVTRYTFEVANYGPEGDFRFTVDDSHRFAQAPSPSQFRLANGASASVTVDLRVPASVDEELTNTLTVTAESTVDSGIRNYAVLRSRVALAALDCSQAVATPTKIWPANHRFQPVSISGVTSSDGGEVALTVDAVMQSEPTHGAGSGATCPDARGIGTSIAEVRAERAGDNRGRVYSILFTASNALGSSCSARVDVCVPHDAETGSCEAPAAAHDSTVCD